MTGLRNVERVGTHVEAAFARSCFLFYCGCLSYVALPFLYQNMVIYLVDVRGCDSLDTTVARQG